MDQSVCSESGGAGVFSIRVWSHRLFWAYAAWYFFTLLIYVMFLMMVCKGTFPEGLKGMSSFLSPGLSFSGFVLLGIFCCGAWYLFHLWKRIFPGASAAGCGLWFLSIPLPVLQPWGMLVCSGRTLKKRWLWTGLLLLGTAAFAGILGCIGLHPALDKLRFCGWLMASFGLILVVQGRLLWHIGQMEMTRRAFRFLMSLAGVTAFAVLTPLFLMNQVEQRLDWISGQLEQLGVPVNPDAARKAYLQGTEPDDEWSRLVGQWSREEELPDNSPEIAAAAAMLKKYSAAAENGKIPDALKKEYPPESPAVQCLDGLMDRGRLLRCRRDYDSLQSAARMWKSEAALSLACGRFFCLRGRQAVSEQGDLSAAEKYWRRCCALAEQLTAAPDALEIVQAGMDVELMGLALTGDIIQSGRLTGDRLSWWRRQVEARRQQYFARVLRALQGMPYAMMDMARRGIPEVGQLRFRNWPGAPVYCYLQNDLFIGLNIQCFMFREMLQPGWRPAGKNAFAGVGFQALLHLQGMTLTPKMVPDIVPALKKSETLFCTADLTAVCAEIEAFRLKNQRLPENLPELAVKLPADPFSGRNYRYLLSPDRRSYTLWGLGMNRLDDGARPERDVVLKSGIRLR